MSAYDDIICKLFSAKEWKLKFHDATYLASWDSSGSSKSIASSCFESPSSLSSDSELERKKEDDRKENSHHDKNHETGHVNHIPK